MVPDTSVSDDDLRVEQSLSLITIHRTYTHKGFLELDGEPRSN